MKKNILALAMGLLLSSTSQAQLQEEESIREVIINFASNADNQEAMALGELLDNNFRIVMNQLFGSSEVSLIDKNTYLSKIKTKEWGGDQRQVKIERISVTGKTASVKVILKGSKMSMASFIQLIKNKDGDWKLISDLPTLL